MARGRPIASAGHAPPRATTALLCQHMCPRRRARPGSTGRFNGLDGPAAQRGRKRADENSKREHPHHDYPHLAPAPDVCRAPVPGRVGPISTACSRAPALAARIKSPGWGLDRSSSANKDETAWPRQRRCESPHGNSGRRCAGAVVEWRVTKQLAAVAFGGVWRPKSGAV